MFYGLTNLKQRYSPVFRRKETNDKERGMGGGGAVGGGGGGGRGGGNQNIQNAKTEGLLILR